MSSKYLNQSINQQNIDVVAHDITANNDIVSSNDIISNNNMVVTNNFRCYQDSIFDRNLSVGSFSNDGTSTETVCPTYNIDLASGATSVDITGNESCFKIQTTSITIGQHGDRSFDINNTTVNDNDLVLISLSSYSGSLGTNGFPQPRIYSVNNNVIRVDINNLHNSNNAVGSYILTLKIINCG